jgi:hypothetical protein
MCEWQVALSTNDTLFHWEVIRLYRLIFSIVVLTDITMHMYLKYKKYTEELVKHKLAQTNQTHKIKWSLRWFINKN